MPEIRHQVSRVLLAPVGRRIQHARDPGQEGVALRDIVLQVCEIPFQFGVEPIREHGFLHRKVVVKRTFGDVGFRGDLLHRHGVIAVGLEQARSGVSQMPQHLRAFARSAPRVVGCGFHGLNPYNLCTICISIRRIVFTCLRCRQAPKDQSMKIAAVTYGTEGDTRPLAALCRALMHAGHDTRLLADIATLSSAAALGVPSAPLSGDIRKALVPGDALSTAVSRKGGFNSTVKALAEIANANTAAWMRELVDASEGCDAIIASGLAAFVGLSVAEYRGIKAIGAGFIPITPTADFPSPFLPPDKVPRWLNRMSHRFVNGLLWRAFRKRTNAARASVCGLHPRKRVWTDHPMIYGVSTHLLPQPDDWPHNAYACGQWSMANPEWMPPPELEDFLAAGEPPIYIGFGSMAGFVRRRLMDELVIAIAGRRALFYSGWSGADASLLPRNFLPIGETNHHWLFPRTSMVIHHGGAGTTHSVARAGVPSVTVPFAGDQFFWANRLQHLGVAGKPVIGKRLRSSEIARCIAYAEREDVRTRSTELSARMAGEDGLGHAVTTLGRLMANL